MSRIPRKELIDESTVGVYHCVQRCVRRAFLCGFDQLTGKCFDHRKVRIQQRMQFLAGQFAVEVLGFAVMSNHFHLVLRNRPDLVANWTDAEVARRWWYLYPQRKDKHGQAAAPSSADLRALTSDKNRFQEIRARLSSISWFMRWLSEKTGREANREDECTGRFFEGRYRCQRLLDDAAVLACTVYVDLNPIRANIARSPETSQFTSVYERIRGLREGTDEDQSPSKRRPTKRRHRTKRLTDRKRLPPVLPRGAWLNPIEINARSSERRSTKTPRASDRGFLPMKLEQYVELLDWTGRQVRSKRGSIPDDLAPILDRLGVISESWVETVKHFGRWFHRAVGRPERLGIEAAARGQRRLHGMKQSRTAFAG